MRLWLLISALILIAPSLAETKTETFQLGSHQVSFNLSVPANYEILPPSLGKLIHSYELNITLLDSDGFARITIEETTMSLPAVENLKNFAAWALEGASDLGDVQHQITKFKGHDAFEMSYPEQRLNIAPGEFIPFAEFHCIAIALDDRTGVMIQSKGFSASIFEELKNSINVSPLKLQVKESIPSQHKDYIGSTEGWAGQGQGEKPGYESSNYFNTIDDPHVLKVENPLVPVAMMSYI